MKVKVTQGHIDAGVHRSYWSCPIALALKDAGLRSPAVWESHFAFGNGEKRIVHRHTPEIRRFVETFDSEELRDKVAPFEFEVPMAD